MDSVERMGVGAEPEWDGESLACRQWARGTTTTGLTDHFTFIHAALASSQAA